MNKKKSYKYLSNAGVTLVELMITVAISGFVISAIYMSFKAQQKSATVQENVTSIQQNIRAATYIMASDIKMAGYDPSGLATDAKIVSFLSNSIHITMDLDGDGNATAAGETNEDITYSLYTNADGVQCVGRKAPNQNRCLAENIDHLSFAYFDSDNNTAALANDIRSVRISIIARSRDADSDYSNDGNYTTANATIINYGGDGFRRRQLITTVNCRNMGL